MGTVTDPSNIRLNRSYPGIDIFKLIAAILVVFIHTNETQEFIPSLIVNAFSRFAVPFFFVASGFFMAISLERKSTQTEKSSYIKSYIKRLAIIYLFWCGINLPSTITSYLELYSNSSIINIALIIFRRCVFAGSGVYWYILIMIEAALIIYMIDKYKKHNLLKILIIAGLLLGILYDTFFDILSNTPYRYINNLFYTVFSWSNNFIMKGVPFMGVGYLIHIYNFKVRNLLLHIVFGLSSLLNIFFFCFKDTLFFGLKLWNVLCIVQAITFFMIAKQISFNATKKVTQTCRELSSVMYFVHCYFIYYVSNAIFGVDFNFWLKSLISISGSILVYVILKLIPFKPLKYVFNIK